MHTISGIMAKYVNSFMFIRNKSEYQNYEHLWVSFIGISYYISKHFIASVRIAYCPLRCVKPAICVSSQFTEWSLEEWWEGSASAFQCPSKTFIKLYWFNEDINYNRSDWIWCGVRFHLRSKSQSTSVHEMW